MKTKLIIFCLIWLSVQAVFAQSSHWGMGSGMAFQLGLNPKSDYITWSSENNDVNIFPRHRISFGPTIQLRPYEKLQIEGSILLTRSNYINPSKTLLNGSNIEVIDYELPLGLRYNLVSPIQYHSSIIYRTGLIGKYRQIPLNTEEKEKISYFIPSFYAGIRLATETKWYGHFEYGVDYVRNFNTSHSFQIAREDAAPVNVDINQRIGQFNVVLSYYFTPRVFNWSKSRYSMDDVLDE